MRTVSRTFGHFAALDNVSLSIEEGSICGLIGPNGAGKTTTMRILATLLDPSAGEAFVGGYSVTEHARDVRRLLGYMPDICGVYRGLTVGEYLDFFGRCCDMDGPSRERAISEVLELVDLGSRREFAMEVLTRGMLQRLSLARTLLHDPMVLLLDEPSSGLDPRARVELRESLKEMRRLGKTILISSHILADLTEVCTHVAIMDKGFLRSFGTLDEMVTRSSGGREFKIELAQAAEVPVDFATRFPELSALTVEKGEVRTTLAVRFQGDDTALAALVARMTAQGIPVVGLRETQLDLEAVFLKSTAPVSE